LEAAKDFLRAYVLQNVQIKNVYDCRITFYETQNKIQIYLVNNILYFLQ